MQTPYTCTYSIKIYIYKDIDFFNASFILMWLLYTLNHIHILEKMSLSFFTFSNNITAATEQI